MLNDGGPVAAVSKRAGYKSAPVTLRIYTHAMPGADEIMMEQFDEEYLVRDYNVTTSEYRESTRSLNRSLEYKCRCQLRLKQQNKKMIGCKQKKLLIYHGMINAVKIRQPPIEDVISGRHGN